MVRNAQYFFQNIFAFLIVDKMLKMKIDGNFFLTTPHYVSYLLGGISLMDDILCIYEMPSI